ncbi:hypothetical protein EBB07_28755 [Paenibacillaceae bacterium]|nr:hypothetical protein EBB07_28755 [Paenibacillaceae bacterium]
MTDMSLIEQMEPGRELDEVFAELIGYRFLTTQLNSDGTFGTIPPYSTTWEGIRFVEQEMQLRGYQLALFHFEGLVGWRWSARFKNDDMSTTDSAPHAVCLAAIRALQGEREKMIEFINRIFRGKVTPDEIRTDEQIKKVYQEALNCSGWGL